MVKTAAALSAANLSIGGGRVYFRLRIQQDSKQVNYTYPCKIRQFIPYSRLFNSLQSLEFTMSIHTLLPTLSRIHLLARGVCAFKFFVFSRALVYKVLGFV